MPNILQYIEKIEHLDKQFIGTIALKSEEITLPDGSKMALGMDDGHWVLVYQKGSHEPFRVYKYNQHEKQVMVDQKQGDKKALKTFKKHLGYFLANASVEDLVTFIPEHN